MVSTDCKYIARIANQFGCTVPFIRPADLASDTASSVDVIKHAINFYQNKLSRSFDYVVLLEPTSPLRTSDDVDDAIIRLVENLLATSVVGICKTESQNFEGSVYVSEISTLLEKGSFYHDQTLGYEFPKWKSFEIDDLDDFIIVEALMSHKRRFM